MERAGRIDQPELFGPTLLSARLRQLGLPDGIRGVDVHDNRSVMVSVSAGDMLRVHRGYAYAPDSVLAAIIAFVAPESSRKTLTQAKHILLDFPVHGFVRGPKQPRKTRPRTRRDDLPVLAELKQRHAALNDRYFDNGLGQVRFRISRRMRRKLGELTLDEADLPTEIAISRRHLLSDGWEEVERTLLHEMVHQWQAENGLPVDHGPTFRAKAEELGAPARAERVINRRVRARLGGS